VDTGTRETQPAALGDLVDVDDLRGGGATWWETWLFACLFIHSFACGGSASTDLAPSAGPGGTGGASVASGGGGSGGRDRDDGGLGTDVSIGEGGGNAAGSGGSRADASAADVRAAEASSQEARRECMDKCERTYFSGASSASLMAGDCCGGSCASSCPSAACFGMSGIFGQPFAKLTCQTCAIVPWRNCTCGAGCTGECKAYMDGVSACL